VPKITLPHGWHARQYQVAAWRALAGGIKRAMLVWPRRHGKDDISLHWTATEAMMRPANYWHLLPLATQARKAIWDAVNPHTGQRRIDEVFPHEIRETTRDQDMLIRFRSGSTWQVGGSDNYMAVLGSPPVGVVFSEYAYGDPAAFDAIRPILLENNGWAIFPSTPNGHNHFHRMYQYARQHREEWFAELLSYKDCGVFTDAQIEREQREIAAEVGDEEAEQTVAQWYLCSFEAAIRGSYYGKIIGKLETDGHLTKVPHDPRVPVITGWDLGVGDSTAIWFVQQYTNRVHVIDYYESAGVGADHYARVLRERGYTYEGHYLPHDAADREWGNNASSRVETLKSLGVKPCRVLPRASVDDGINAVRMLLPRCYIDAEKCLRGIDALRNYQREWDEKLKVYSNKPFHDWSSHGADAIRTLAQGLKAPRDDAVRRQRYAET